MKTDIVCLSSKLDKRLQVTRTKEFELNTTTDINTRQFSFTTS